MSFEPIPAEGDGAELFDLPSLFYLSNQQMIEEWAALAGRVTANVDRWLRTVVRETFAVRCAQRGLVVSLIRAPGRNTALVAHPADATLVGVVPAIAAGLAWETSKVFPTDATVFCGVVSANTATGRAASQLFRDAGGSDLALVRGYVPRGVLWPVWRWVSAPDGWWMDLDAYRYLLVADAFDLVDSVLEPLLAASYVPLDLDDAGAAAGTEVEDDDDDDDVDEDADDDADDGERGAGGAESGVADV